MNKSLIAALLLVCVGALYAKEPSKKIKAELAALTAATTQQVALEAAQAKKAAKEEQAKAAAAKQEQDAEESVVMIDSKAEAEEEGVSAASRPEPEERTVPGGLPLSYGQCKGVITEAGRNLLVFESLDDGTITFVQVTVGKTNISWKLVDRIPRSAD
jgi:hypothetical protein